MTKNKQNVSDIPKQADKEKLLQSLDLLQMEDHRKEYKTTKIILSNNRPHQLRAAIENYSTKPFLNVLNNTKIRNENNTVKFKIAGSNGKFSKPILSSPDGRIKHPNKLDNNTLQKYTKFNNRFIRDDKDRHVPLSSMQSHYGTVYPPYMNLHSSMNEYPDFIFPKPPDSVEEMSYNEYLGYPDERDLTMDMINKFNMDGIPASSPYPTNYNTQDSRSEVDDSEELNFSNFQPGTSEEYSAETDRPSQNLTPQSWDLDGVPRNNVDEPVSLENDRPASHHSVGHTQGMKPYRTPNIPLQIKHPQSWHSDEFSKNNVDRPVSFNNGRSTSQQWMKQTRGMHPSRTPNISLQITRPQSWDADETPRGNVDGPVSGRPKSQHPMKQTQGMQSNRIPKGENISTMQVDKLISKEKSENEQVNNEDDDWQQFGNLRGMNQWKPINGGQNDESSEEEPNTFNEYTNSEETKEEKNSDDNGIFEENDHDGFLDMGAYTDTMGAFGWYADFPVGRGHDKISYS